MNPLFADLGSPTSMTSVGGILLALCGSLFFALVIAWVYKMTHRGLSYSHTFMYSLVLLGILGSVVMIVASGSLLRAIGILGAFSLIRFRTAIKDPKDMAYILFVLSIGLAMGAQMYALAFITTIFVCAVILVLTWTNFGMTTSHESVIRFLVQEKGANSSAAHVESALEKIAQSSHLLSAHTQGSRIEFVYGVRPKRGKTSVDILLQLKNEKGVEHVELFDSKHQVEF